MVRKHGHRLIQVVRVCTAWLLLLGVVAGTGRGIDPASAAPGDSPITGRVFVDVSRDGNVDAGELLADTDPLFPTGGVTITAYDTDGGSSTAVVSSSPAGVIYTVDLAGLAGSEVRLELVLSAAAKAAGWTETFVGDNHQGFVAFGSAGDPIDFGVIPPSQCPTSGTGADGNANNASGKIWTTCFVNGGLAGGGPQDVLVGLNYDTAGSVEKISNKPALGAVWGLGYDEWDSVLFTSAYLKRHSALGPQGIDGLYWFVYPNETPFSVSLDTLGGPSYGSVGARDADGAAFNAPSHDPATYAQVGKTGIGDIDVTPDGKTLLVTNIEAKAIVAYDVSDAQNGNITYVGHYNITNSDVSCPNNSGSADASDWFPFALEPFDGRRALVGVSCTGQTSNDAADLEAVILSVPLDLAGPNGAVAPSGSASSVHSFGLDYDRYCLNSGACGSSSSGGAFLPWSDTFPAYTPAPGGAATVAHTSAIISDINIEPDGSLTVSVMDRAGDQFGSLNYTTNTASNQLIWERGGGDLIKVCNTSGDRDNPTWVTEGSVGCTGSFVDNPGANQYHNGPGAGREWYGADTWSPPSHPENTVGGAWVHPAVDAVVSPQFDPDPAGTFFAGGLAWLDTADGSKDDNLILYQGTTIGVFGAQGFLGKANGIGDVQGCFIPVSLGNRVWLDADKDGLQDPDELALAGVTVTVTGTGLGSGVTVTTDGNGLWSVDSSDGLRHGVAYTITYDPTTASNLPSGALGSELVATAPSTSAPGLNDGNDSDLPAGTLSITTSALAVGEVNNDYDAGFMGPEDLALATVLDSVDPVSNEIHLTYTVAVKNQGLHGSEGFSVTDEIPAGMSFVSASDGGAETALGSGIVVWTIDPADELAPGEMVMLELVLEMADQNLAPFTNTAEISADTIDDDDSTPDAILTGAGADNLVDITDLADLETDGPAGSSTPDEDDHDIAVWSPSYDLALANIISNVDAAAANGIELTYEITVKNQGDLASGTFVISDELPVGTAFVSASDGGTETTPNSGLVVWNIATVDEIPVGDSITVTLVVEVIDAAQAPFTNTAEISADEGVDDDSTPDTTLTGPGADNLVDITDVTDLDTDGPAGSSTPDEDDHDVAVWSPTYDLALANILASTSADGEQITYEITVRNQGDLFSGSFVVTDELASGTSFVSADHGGTETAPNSGIVSWTVAAADQLAPNEQVTFTLVAQVDDALLTPFQNVAEISSASGSDDDSTPDNDLSGPSSDNLVDIIDVDDLLIDTNTDTPDEDDHDIATIEVPLYRIGNLVWLDANDDGIANDDEPGIAGVDVELWVDGGTVALDTETTDADGKYVFSGLAADDYYLVIPGGQSGQTIGTQGYDLADLFVSTTAVNDPDGDVDVDNDNNGFDGIGRIETGVISIGDLSQFVPDEPVDETLRGDGPNGLVDDDDDTLPDAQSNYSLDIGFVEPLRVGNLVWLDDGGGFGSGGYLQTDDDDGQADAGESGIEGVLVQLLNGGVVVEETVTDADGRYLFTGLVAGTYEIGIPADQTTTLPGLAADALDGRRSSTPTSATVTAADDDDDGSAGAEFLARSGSFVLAYGTHATDELGDFADPTVGAAEAAATAASSFVGDANSNLEVDFGFVDVPLYRIGNLVWEDYDDDGVAETGEPGIEGVLVQLLDDDGVVVQEVVTTADGTYEFSGLEAGTYQVQIPADQQSELGTVGAIAGVLDGLRTSGTPDSDPDAPTDADNNNDGREVSSGLLSGELELGEGDNHSEITAETARDDDSTLVEDGTVRDDRSNLAVDIGLFRGLRVGNQLFLDGNQGEPMYNNGVFDAGEIGIGGVTVELWADDGSGTFNPVGGTPVHSTVTDTEGNYLFTGLEEGVGYFIAVRSIPTTEPGDRSSTGTSTDPAAVDNEDDGAPAAGYESVSARFELDTDDNDDATDGSSLGETDTVPSEDAEAEANAKSGLYPDGNSELAIDFGFVDVPLYRIGNLIWEDLDNDGLAETGEPGLEGVLVQLLDESGVLVDETATDSEGRYFFESLAAGDYSVLIPSDQMPDGADPVGFDATALDGFVSSTRGEEADPNDDVDNNDNGRGSSDWSSGIVSLGEAMSLPPTGGEPSNEQRRSDDATDDDPNLGVAGSFPDDLSNLTVDFGFVRLTLGNQVFLDVNDNGVLDGDEAGIGDVVVDLYDVSGPTPALVATTVTDSDGTYLFDTLLPDTEYVVEIPASEFGAGEPLENLFSSTDPGVGVPDPDGDEGVVGDGIDGDDNGADPVEQGLPVRSLPVVVAPGDEPTGETPDNGTGARDDGQNLTLDFGFHNGLRIGTTVWLDDGNDAGTDENGVADLSESGIEGVTVALYVDDGDVPGQFDSADSLVDTTETDPNGLAVFEHLSPAPYLLVIPETEQSVGEELAGLVSTFDGLDDDTTNNDDNGSTVVGTGIVSTPIELSFGDEPITEGVDGTTGVAEEDGTYADDNSNFTVDFGLIETPTYRIGNLIWEDLNNDGLAQDGEPGIEGVLVQLLDDSDSVIAETLTDSAGTYSFADLAAGDYAVRVPSAQVPEVDAGLAPTPGALDGLSSSTNGEETDPNNDVDNNDNGLGPDDPTSGPITVGEGNIDGEPDNETVRFDDPTDDDDDFPSGESDGRSNYSVDFGYYRLTLGNQVFYDWNNSGDVDRSDESGIADVLVSLLDASDDSVIETTTTDASGLYLFEGLTDGSDYIVQIDASNFTTGGVLDGFHSSTGPNVGADPDDDETDNDDNGSSGIAPLAVRSDVISLVVGDEPLLETGADNDSTTVDENENRSVDFGFYTNTVGNAVWLDSNDDGSFDPTEIGIADVVVTLVDPSDDSVVDTVTTDPSGQFLFTGVPDGTYVVEIAPSNFAPDPDGDGSLTAGALHGLSSSPPEADPDDVTVDDDDNGSNEAAPATPAFEVLAGGAPTATGDASNADPLVPLDSQNLNVDFGFHGLSLGNLVFIDLNGDGTFNELTEAGRPDVKVELWETDGAGTVTGVSPVATTTTDDDGHYLFVDLEPGEYIVVIPTEDFEQGGPLYGYISTIGNGVDAPDVDDNELDGDDNGDPQTDGSTRSDPILLVPAGEPTAETDVSTNVDHVDNTDDQNSNLTVDFGFEPRPGIALGNRVWNDLDGDGVQDPTEPGLDGVRVELVDAAGDPVTFDVTDNGGYYLFPGLDAGEYVVVIPAENFDEPTDALWGLFPAVDPTGQPTDPDDDIDGDDDGQNPAAAFGAVESLPVTLADLFEPVDELDIEPPGSHIPTDPNDNLTVDFAFVQVSVGGTVFEDPAEDGQQDPTDEPIEGVVARLLDEIGEPIVDGAGSNVTAVTDVDGSYVFEGVAPGTYIVQIPETVFHDDGVLDGWASTRGNVDPATGLTPDPDDGDGANDGDDNGDPVGDDVFGETTVQSQPVTLAVGTEPTGETPDVGSPTVPDENENLTVDFGFWEIPLHELGGVIWIDADNGGIVDGDEVGAPAGIIVNLLDVDGASVLDNGGVAITDETDPDGFYLFERLEPGDYIVEIDRSNVRTGDVIEGYWPSTGDGVSDDPNDDASNASDGFGQDDHSIRSLPVTLYPESEPTDDLDAVSTLDGYSNLTVDFGIYSVEIAASIWFDLDDDGVVDPDEVPSPGVRVALLTEAGEPVVDSNGEPIVVTTNEAGHYLFVGIPEGTYIVSLLALNFEPNGPLHGYVGSSASGNAGFQPDGSFHSVPFMVTAGVNDLGTGVLGVSVGLVPVGEISGFAWLDEDGDGIRDDNEPGAEGVLLRLTAEGSTEETSTESASDGSFVLADLLPDDYTLEAIAPDGRTFTVPNVGDDGRDSDVNERGLMTNIRVTPGSELTNVGVGLVSTTPGGLAFTGSSPHRQALVASMFLVLGAAFIAGSRRRKGEPTCNG